MRHMMLLLACSFILVNAVSGYLNADPALASATVIKTPFNKFQEQLQIQRVFRSPNNDERYE